MDKICRSKRNKK